MENKVGIVLNFESSLNLDHLQQDLYNLAHSNDTRDRCRRVAESNFSLEDGIQKYKKIYRLLIERG